MLTQKKQMISLPSGSKGSLLPSDFSDQVCFTEVATHNPADQYPGDQLAPEDRLAAADGTAAGVPPCQLDSPQRS